MLHYRTFGEEKQEEVIIPSDPNSITIIKKEKTRWFLKHVNHHAQNHTRLLVKLTGER